MLIFWVDIENDGLRQRLQDPGRRALNKPKQDQSLGSGRERAQ